MVKILVNFKIISLVRKSFIRFWRLIFRRVHSLTGSHCQAKDFFLNLQYLILGNFYID